jgi:hypothetical protein
METMFPMFSVAQYTDHGPPQLYTAPRGPLHPPAALRDPPGHINFESNTFKFTQNQLEIGSKSVRYRFEIGTKIGPKISP